MNEQYIYMNKEENRVIIENNSLTTLFSGDLSITSFPVNFKPIIVKGTLWEKFCNLFSNLKMIKVNTSITFSIDYFDGHVLAYEWLLLVDTGRVYRVWNGRNTNPRNCSQILSDGGVMLKGVGTFKCEDFKVFNFSV